MLCKLNSTRFIYSFIRFWSRDEYRNFYSPQTFKIVALQMATRPLFVPVDMSTVVPSFNSTAPTTFFSFTTLTLFSFSHWTTIKAIFRNVILSKTVEKNDQLMKSTFKDERQIESSLFPITAWSRGSFKTCNWLAKWIRWLADCSVKRSAQLYFEFSDRFSASRRWIPWWYK